MITDNLNKSIVVNMDMGWEHLLLDAQLIVKIIIM